MKISFGAVPLVNGYAGLNTKQHKSYNQSNCIDSQAVLPSAAAYSSVIFHARANSDILLSQTDKLRCAYSRKPMISPYKLRTIFAKLGKKTTAQSAINFLKEYKNYMLDVETKVFDMFEKYGASGQVNFQDILLEKRPEALANLKNKQKEILNSTNDYILSFDEDFADELFYLRDVALLKVEDGSFSRHGLLDQLKDLKTPEKYKNEIHEIYKNWYNLPRSYTDFDAFIVKYSKFSHEEIAQRLLSMSAASVEHIESYSKGGEDKLKNLALTCKLYNQDKGDMSLAEYDEFNPEIGIKHNLTKYIDDVVREINNGDTFFVKNKTYPEDLKAQIMKNTGWKMKTKKAVVKQTEQTSKLTSSRKGANRYRNYRR